VRRRILLACSLTLLAVLLAFVALRDGGGQDRVAMPGSAVTTPAPVAVDPRPTDRATRAVRGIETGRAARPTALTGADLPLSDGFEWLHERDPRESLLDRESARDQRTGAMRDEARATLLRRLSDEGADQDELQLWRDLLASAEAARLEASP
jgi:hypothetical protein